MKSLDFMEALGQADPEIVQEVIETMDNEKSITRTRNKRILRIALAAAVVMALLAGSVYAVSLSRMHLDEAQGVSGTWNSQHVEFKDAELLLTFDVEGEVHPVGFKANYLPSGGNMSGRLEKGGQIAADPDYVTYLGDWGADGLKPVPIIIECMNGADMEGMTYAINGHAEIMKQDTWNGYERTEIHLDMRDIVPEGSGMQDQYDLLLYSAENNYLIRVGSGEFGFDELEKVAENLDVKVFPGEVEPMERYGDIAYFNIGRG